MYRTLLRAMSLNKIVSNIGANALSAVSPGIIVLMRCPKVGTGDEQVMVSAQLEQSMSSRVHFTHAELSTAERATCRDLHPLWH